MLTVLRTMIASGRLAPGDHLEESELACALGVSRGPIRKSFARLEVEGQVELRHHRGAFVTQLTRRHFSLLATSFPRLVEGGHAEHLMLRETPVGGDPVTARAAAEYHIVCAYERLQHLPPSDPDAKDATLLAH